MHTVVCDTEEQAFREAATLLKEELAVTISYNGYPVAMYYQSQIRSYVEAARHVGMFACLVKPARNYVPNVLPEHRNKYIVS